MQRLCCSTSWGLLLATLFFPLCSVLAAGDPTVGSLRTRTRSGDGEFLAACERDSAGPLLGTALGGGSRATGSTVTWPPGGWEPMSGTPGSYTRERSDEIGSPFHISGAPAYGWARHEQIHPGTAFNGTNFLLAWLDNRVSSLCIYAARVSASGDVLDPAGILVSLIDASNSSPAPSVASDGTDYFIVWHARSYARTDYDIQGARVSGAGEVLDSTPITISSAPNDQLFPSVVFDGTAFLVVWHDKRSGLDSDIYAAHVTSSGLVLEPEGFPVSTAGGNQRLPALASDGTDCLVAWEDYRNGTDWDIYGACITHTGEVLDPDGIELSSGAGDQRFPSAGFGAGQYLSAWVNFRDDPYGDIYAARVTASGHVVDSTGIRVSATSSEQKDPVVLFADSVFIVAWTDGQSADNPDVCCTRISSDGTVADPSRNVISGLETIERDPAMAFGGGNCLVAWEDQRNGWDSDVVGARMSSSGFLVDTQAVTISTGADYEWDPATAYDGTNYLAVWCEDRGYAYDIYGARVNAGGEVLDTTSLVVCGEAGTQNHPGTASDGSAFLVVWADGRNVEFGNIYGTIVSDSGAVLDVGGRLISPASGYQGYPAVAFGGTNYLVAYREWKAWPYFDIYGVRVNLSGEPLDSVGIPISVYNAGEYDPDVASNGTSYLVAFWIYCDEQTPGFYCGLYAAYISATGELLDRRKIWPLHPYTEYQASPPRIASDGTNYLVVWAGNGDDPCGICGLRLNATGIPIDSNAIVISPTGYCCPDVEFDGVNYRVVWEEDRPDTWLDIIGTRVSPNGEVLEPYEVAISTERLLQLTPTLTKGSTSDCLVAYSSFVPPPIYSSQQICGNLWYGPTALTFASASATVTGGYVRLSWQMGVEVHASAFSVTRSESLEGEYTLIDAPIVEGKAYTFSCVDHYVVPGKTYWYKILLTSLSGQKSYGPIEVRVTAVPLVYRAYQSYPNPFNPVCKIRYDLPEAGEVSLRVFDVKGSLVRTLVNGWREPGQYGEDWDGRSDDGRALSSGVYFYRLCAGDFVATRKMVLLR